jgi:hypothetical protein
LTGSGTTPNAAHYCRNCQRFLGTTPGQYCSHCGQDTRTHPPSVLEFLHEFITHYVALEGRLWRTLGLLFFRPGELTVRYWAGMKNRYVLPLRLYISASLLFFLVVKVLGAGNLVKLDKTAPQAERPVAQQGGVRVDRRDGAVLRFNMPRDAELTTPFVNTIECDFVPSQCDKVKDFVRRKYGDKPVGEVGEGARARVLAYAPYAMFAMMPLFALLTLVLYARRGRTYGEHLVYALHIHAFTFLLLLAVALVSEALSGWLMLYAMICFWLALRRAFGGRWWPTLMRYTFIGMVYPLLLVVVVLAAFAAAILI